MKKNIAIYIMLLLAPLTFLSCDQWGGETVESAYREPQIPDPTYQFKRNGSSSIDYQECGLLRDPLDYIYNSYLKIASIMYQANMDKVQDYFCNGEFGLKPKEELASSPLHKADRARILKDVEDIFHTTGVLSGLSKPSPGTYRNRKAKPGQGGYVGTNIGDVNIAFANEKGVIVAEMFNGIVWGGSIWIRSSIRISTTVYTTTPDYAVNMKAQHYSRDGTIRNLNTTGTLPMAIISIGCPSYRQAACLCCAKAELRSTMPLQSAVRRSPSFAMRKCKLSCCLLGTNCRKWLPCGL